MVRHRPPRRAEQVDALLHAPLLHQLTDDLADRFPRRRRHPLALYLAFGALARLYGSGNRLDAELEQTDLWHRITTAYTTATGHGLAPHLPPVTSDTYRHFRDRLTAPDTLEELAEAFTRHSVDLARELGLLLPDGPGSRTWPHPTRTIYGDGTIVRPLYRPTNEGRRDHDATEHQRHDGPMWGNNLVFVAVRGPEPHRRVILAAGRAGPTGGEAAHAVALFERVHSHAGEGIQAIVYDGAFRGVHHEHLMRNLGVVVINRPHAATKTDQDERTWRNLTLGTWTHRPSTSDCHHTLVVNGGNVHDSRLDDAGQLHLSDPLRRVQVRRYPRGRRGGWRFSLGVEVTCPRGPFTAWISPHTTTSDRGHGRPDQLRLLNPADPYFLKLYGLRNDSESINAAYKRTLPADRAAARGWRRQLLDATSWAILSNAYAWSLHRPATSTAA